MAKFTIQFRDTVLTDRGFDSVSDAVNRGLARAYSNGPFDVSDRHEAIVWAWEQRPCEPQSLFRALQSAGVPYDNHESDLYVPDSPEARAILASYPEQATAARRFVSEIDRTMWIDIPFAFLPWWEARQRLDAYGANLATVVHEPTGGVTKIFRI